MKKYLVLSFDDGTVYDKRVIDLLNSYGLRGTFNLNSGLQDYKYELEGKLIERLDLKANRALYDGHEVASHTLTHANLFKISKEEMLHEVLEDIKNLEDIFNKPITSIGIPYSDYDEERLELIKANTRLKCFRFPMLKAKGDNTLPIDEYHIPKNAVYDDLDAMDKLRSFEDYNGDGIFVLLADPYKIEVYNKWDYFNELIAYIASSNKFEVKPMTEAAMLLFNK